MRHPFLHLTLPTLLALALLAAAGGARSAPGTEQVDPLSQLLSERGLLAATPLPAVQNPALVRQVRDGASDLVVTALNFLGAPYKHGGSSEVGGFDCSGFTRYIVGLSHGLVLPRRVDEQAKAPGLAPVARSELQPGDLVFFNTLKRTFSHVGIYVGDGKFIHSPRPGGEVRVEQMGVAYWHKRFTGARRLDGLTPAVAAAPASSASSIEPGP